MQIRARFANSAHAKRKSGRALQIAPTPNANPDALCKKRARQIQNRARFANSARANFKSRLALNFAPDSGTYLSKQKNTSRHHSQSSKQFSCSELRLRTGIDSVRFRNALAIS